MCMAVLVWADEPEYRQVIDLQSCPRRHLADELSKASKYEQVISVEGCRPFLPQTLLCRVCRFPGGQMRLCSRRSLAWDMPRETTRSTLVPAIPALSAVSRCNGSRMHQHGDQSEDDVFTLGGTGACYADISSTTPMLYSPQLMEVGGHGR